MCWPTTMDAFCLVHFHWFKFERRPFLLSFLPFVTQFSTVIHNIFTEWTSTVFLNNKANFSNLLLKFNNGQMDCRLNSNCCCTCVCHSQFQCMRLIYKTWTNSSLFSFQSSNQLLCNRNICHKTIYGHFRMRLSGADYIERGQWEKKVNIRHII